MRATALTVRRSPVAGSRGRRVAALALLLTASAACSSATSNEAGGSGGAGTGPSTASSASASPSPSPSPAPPIQLPRGGRAIFPRYQVVMAYGTAGTGSLGVLGEVPPQEAATRLLQAAIPYGKPSGRQVQPAFELITTVAQASAGADGTFSYPQPPDKVQPYLDVARKNKYLLVLDFQPGRANFLDQVKSYEKFLLEPEVGVALDPEWVLKPGQRPTRQIGSTTATDINAVSSYLANLTLKHKLPEKLFLVHQFQSRMIADRDKMVDRPGLATVVQMDGNGSQQLKKETYAIIADTQGDARPAGRIHNGFKLFFDEDTNLMTPAEAMALTPRPEVISYQ